jgi:nucleoside-diphosphate-sugar epimerase
MNVLVIGGTRFIGRAIVGELLRRGHLVMVYHRGQREVAFSGPVVHVHGDRREYAEFGATLARLPFEAVIDVIPMNAADARHLVEALGDRAARVVIISSGDVYAPGQPIPLSEDAAIGPPEPVEIQAYGEAVSYSKVAMEAVIGEAWAGQRFPATVLRLPAVYGPGSRVREWFFVKRVLDGRRRLALPDGGLHLFHRGYVEDVARAAVLALESPQAAGRTYNVGHENVLTMRGIAELVAQVMGYDWEIVSVPAAWLPPNNPFATAYPIVYDLGRIRAELGYRDTVSLEEGMRRTVEWLVANPPDPQERAGADPFDYAAEDAAISAVEKGGPA